MRCTAIAQGQASPGACGFSRPVVIAGYQKKAEAVGNFLCEAPEIAGSWAHQKDFLQLPKKSVARHRNTLYYCVSEPRSLGGLGKYDRGWGPSCPTLLQSPAALQFLYAFTWDSPLFCFQPTGLSAALRYHSTLGWDHLSPGWYPALTHRVEGSPLSKSPG